MQCFLCEIVNLVTHTTLASSPKSECAGCRQEVRAGSKTLHQQNPPVLNWSCQLAQVNLYNGRKTGGCGLVWLA